MQIKRTISYPILSATPDQTDTLPLNFLEDGDQVRVGFTKGTLNKATFETSFGAVITYEKAEE